MVCCYLNIAFILKGGILLIMLALNEQKKLIFHGLGKVSSSAKLYTKSYNAKKGEEY